MQGITVEPWLIGLLVTQGVVIIGGLVNFAVRFSKVEERVKDLEKELGEQKVSFAHHAATVTSVNERLVRIETILERIEKKQ